MNIQKAAALSLAVLALASSAPALRAETTTTTSQDQAIHRTNVPSTPIWKNREFWRNEKERSGLPHFWEGTKDFFRRANPAPWFREQRARYEERRVSSATNADRAAARADRAVDRVQDEGRAL